MKRCILLTIALSMGVWAQSVTPSYKTLKYPPLRDVKIPDVATFTLSNGIKLYLLEDHELPTVRGFALVRTGNLFDPKDKIGLASITGMEMRAGGTLTKTGDQIDEQLENIAATVESRIEESFGQVSFSTLKNTTDEVLGIFHGVIASPEFRDDKIELAKTQFRSSISRRNDDAGGIAQREFTNMLYGKDTPYGWQIEYQTVDHIQRADLQAFYRRYYFPANTIIAMAGDFQAAEMRAKIEKLFADWTVKQAPVPAFPAVDRTSRPGTYLAVKTNVTQTNFIFGQLGGELRDKDYPALEVMADILGGGFRSRLFTKVRTAFGYAYNIYADWGANYDHPGLFQIGGSTKSASTTEAIKASLDELNRIRTQEVTKEELETAKQTVVNSFVFNFDTPSKTLQRLVTYEYYGYPKDFIYQYQKNVLAVTAADILRIAKARIDPANLAIVAVGNPKDFGQALTTLGKQVTNLDIAIPSPDGPAAEAKAHDSGDIDKGRELLKQVQSAAGGLGKLTAVKDVKQTATMQLDPSAGGMKSSQVNYWIVPGAFRQENTLPFGKIVAYSNGKIGWFHSMQGTMQLSGAQLKQIQGEMFRGYVGLLLSDRDPGRTVSLTGPNTIAISDKDGDAAQLTIDPATKLISTMSYQQEQPSGPPSQVTIGLSDYRDVEGIKLPYKLSLKQGDRKLGDITVSEYKINSGITPEEIAKPQ